MFETFLRNFAKIKILDLTSTQVIKFYTKGVNFTLTLRPSTDTVVAVPKFGTRVLLEMVSEAFLQYSEPDLPVSESSFQINGVRIDYTLDAEPVSHTVGIQ